MNTDKLVLITGASSGVGLSLARHLAGEYRVIAAARRIDRLENEFGDNPNVDTIRLDLSDPDEVKRRADELVGRHGFIGYLVNNAGVNIKAGVQEMDSAQLAHSFAVNSISPLVLMQKLLPAMVAHNFGRIINVTSGAPLNCFPGFGAYSATKGALNALTVSAARELEEHNIKINLMSPGPVKTEMAPQAPMDPSVAHPTVEHLLSLPADGPTGRFFWLGRDIPLFPDLSGIEWLEGRAPERFKRVL